MQPRVQITDMQTTMYEYDMDSQIQRRLAEYFQTGNLESLHITSENLNTFLHLAICLHNIDMKQYCEKQLLASLDPFNSVDMFLLAQAHQCDELQQKSTDMLANNFGILWNASAFQHLGKNELKRLLEIPQIHQHPKITDALQLWMNYERDFREENHRELLEFLKNIQSTSKNPRFNPYRKSVRRCRKSPRFAVLFSHDEATKKSPSTLVIDLQNFRTHHTKVKQMQNFCSGFAVCFVAVDDAPYIFVSGGREPKPCQMARYDVILNKWKDCKKMSCCRLDHSMVPIGENIFVVGGHNERSILSCIEEYNPGSNSWKTVGELIQPVRNAACTAYNDKIYIFGGKLFDGRRVATVQCFDTTSRKVRQLTDLPCRSSSGKAIVVNEQIFYASDQGHMYRFDPQSESCYECSPPLIRLRKFAMFTDSDHLFMACGVGEVSGAVDCLLKYKPVSNIWTRAGKLEVALPVDANCTVEFPKSFSVVPFKD